MDWNRQTVLVTGAGGFIGSHLAERLVELGAKTRALVEYNSNNSWGWIDESTVKHEITVTLGDIRDPESMRQAFENIDIVFHLAALIAIPYSYRAPQSYVSTNISGTLNVLQEANSGGADLVVHTSTSEVYGSAGYVPMDEAHPIQSQSPYSASKTAADEMAKAFHLSFGLPVSIIRPFNTFGPRQSSRAVIPTIITQALAGDSVQLGSLTPSRDFNYVADTVEGFIRIAECPAAVGQVVNVGSGREITIGDLASTILSLTGSNVPIVEDPQRVRPENSEVDRLCADSTKAKELLGWGPEYSLEEGLSETIEWVRKNSDRFKTGVYSI
jgi:NAD dependent epimerase/dehydratase